MTMKAVIALILAFSLFEVSAVEIQVHKMKKSPGYDERYDLNTSMDEKIVVDCQSFVQGLLFGEVGESVVMLPEWECDELIVDMKKSVSRFKKHCLEVDRDRAVMDSHQTCK